MRIGDRSGDALLDLKLFEIDVGGSSGAATNAAPRGEEASRHLGWVVVCCGSNDYYYDFRCTERTRCPEEEGTESEQDLFGLPTRGHRRLRTEASRSSPLVECGRYAIVAGDP